jgi:hypothetical protein
MILFESPKPLVWGDLDLPLFGLGADWFGDRFQPAVGFALAKDAERLWFLASHTSPALLHPQARPGKFQPELWKYDVAELFLADPKSGYAHRRGWRGWRRVSGRLHPSSG